MTYRIKRSPSGNLFVWSDYERRWMCWSPNGEFWEDPAGDELTENDVTDWPETSLSRKENLT